MRKAQGRGSGINGVLKELDSLGSKGRQLITVNVATDILNIKGLDKAEGNIANNLIKLLEDKWE